MRVAVVARLASCSSSDDGLREDVQASAACALETDGSLESWRRSGGYDVVNGRGEGMKMPERITRFCDTGRASPVVCRLVCRCDTNMPSRMLSSCMVSSWSLMGISELWDFSQLPSTIRIIVARSVDIAVIDRWKPHQPSHQYQRLCPQCSIPLSSIWSKYLRLTCRSEHYG